MWLKNYSGDRPCILWKTELPPAGGSITAPDFSLLHLDCKLEFRRHKNAKNEVYYSFLLSNVNSVEGIQGIVKVHVADEWGHFNSITNCIMYLTPNSTHISRFQTKFFNECRVAVTENKVTLVFDFWCTNCSEIKKRVSQVKEEAHVPSSSPVKSCTESLVEDLQKLLEEGSQHDLELKCGDKSIPAHKSILSARSTVFAAMLRNDMQEGRSGVVDIADVEFPVLQHFVRYIYCGTLPQLTAELASDLFKAGDKYAVKTLMKRCSQFLVESLTVENACEFLVLADDHSDSEFKESVISYILDVKIPKRYDGWDQFCSCHQSLGLEVLNRYMRRN